MEDSTFNTVNNKFPQSVGAQFKQTNGSFYIQNKNDIIQIQSVGDVPDFSVGDLIVVDGININFVVHISNKNYTSRSLKDKLVKANQENNPYVSLEYITIVNIDGERYKDLIDTQLARVESDSNVNVTRTIYTDIDIIKQINWSVTPVNNIDEPSYATKLGTWAVDGFGDSEFNYENPVIKRPRTDFDPQDEGNNDQDSDQDSDQDDNGDELTVDDSRRRTSPDTRREQPRSGEQTNLNENI